jgi:hypothetical protein
VEELDEQRSILRRHVRNPGERKSIGQPIVDGAAEARSGSAPPANRPGSA